MSGALPVHENKALPRDDSLDEKDEVEVEALDAENLKDVEELEQRIANDEADDKDYRVEEAHEVAIKARRMDACMRSIAQRCS